MGYEENLHEDECTIRKKSRITPHAVNDEHDNLFSQTRFPIEGKRVTCCESKLTNSLGKQQLELSTRT